MTHRGHKSVDKIHLMSTMTHIVKDAEIEMTITFEDVHIF